MAYPGEGEHVKYLDYVEETVSAGQKPLSKEEWRKMMKEEEKMAKKKIKSAMSEY